MGNFDQELCLTCGEMAHSAGINDVNAQQCQLKSQPISNLLFGRGVKQIDFATP
jgi:hypothetical protein